MTSLADEIKHMNTFLSAQSALLGPNVEQVMDGQASTLVEKVMHLTSLDAQAAAELTQAVSAGPWTAAQKSKLAAAVGSRLSITVPISGPTSGGSRRRSNQVIMSLHNYLTEADINVLRGDATDMAKLGAITEILEKLGIDIPSEQSIKHIISVFWLLARPCSSDNSLCYTYVLELKRLLKARPKTFALARLTCFPDNPKDLPSEFYNHVFPEGDRPTDAGIDFKRIVTMAGNVACRKTNKIVRTEVSSTSSSSSQLNAFVSQQLMPMLAHHLGLLPAPRQRVPGITLLPQRSSLAEQLALTAPHPNQPEVAPLPITFPTVTGQSFPSQPAAAAAQPSTPAHVPTPFSLPAFTSDSADHHNSLMAAALNSRAAENAKTTETDEDPPGTTGRRGRKPGPKAALKAAAAAEAKQKLKPKDKKKIPVKKTGNTKVSKAQKIAAASAKTEKTVKSKESVGSKKGVAVRASELSMKERMRLRPDGCARCRNTPGCCPSCSVRK